MLLFAETNQEDSRPGQNRLEYRNEGKGGRSPTGWLYVIGGVARWGKRCNVYSENNSMGKQETEKKKRKARQGVSKTSHHTPNKALCKKSKKGWGSLAAAKTTGLPKLGMC